MAMTGHWRRDHPAADLTVDFKVNSDYGTPVSLSERTIFHFAATGTKLWIGVGVYLVEAQQLAQA